MKVTIGSLTWHANEGDKKEQKQPHKFAYLTMKNRSFARFGRAFFIFAHFVAVLLISTTLNDLSTKLSENKVLICTFFYKATGAHFFRRKGKGTPYLISEVPLLSREYSPREPTSYRKSVEKFLIKKV